MIFEPEVAPPSFETFLPTKRLLMRPLPPRPVLFPSIAVAWIALTSASASPQETAPVEVGSPAAPAEVQRLNAAFEKVCDSFEVTGVSAALLLPSGARWTRARGIAAKEEPMRSDHLLEIGSVTKTYTSALVLGLVSEGAIELDAPVADWLAGVAHLEGVTVRHLLQQTSGLYDYTDHPEYLGSMKREFSRSWSARDLLEKFGGEPLFLPGEHWDYSNTNYLVLGLLAEAITKQPAHEALRARVLEPLALEHTFFGGAEELEGERAHAFVDINADGKPEDLSALVPNTSFITSAWTAGAILATAEDAARWMRAFGSGEALDSDRFYELTRWRERGDGMVYGLGLILDPRGAFEIVGHKGNSAGYSASVWHAPKFDLTVAVLTNANGIDVTPIATALLDAALGRPGAASSDSDPHD